MNILYEEPFNDSQADINKMYTSTCIIILCFIYNSEIITTMLTVRMSSHFLYLQNGAQAQNTRENSSSKETANAEKLQQSNQLQGYLKNKFIKIFRKANKNVKGFFVNFT